MRTIAHVRARARGNFESCARARTRTRKFFEDAHAHAKFLKDAHAHARAREKNLRCARARTRTRKSRVFWNYGVPCPA